MYSDFHIHSHFSADSNESPENIIQKCIALNMNECCFTEHQDFNWPISGQSFDLEVSSYFKTIKHLKDIYNKKIYIGIGIECGLMPENAHLNSQLICVNPFDFVIGSCHIVDGMDPYYPVFFENRSDHEAFQKYFSTLLLCIKDFSNFDILGHMDYIVRYCPNKDSNYSAFDYMDIIDEILKTVIGNGKGIEINTSGLKSGLLQTNPSMDILKRYKEFGGEIITIGSDAHTCDYIGYEFKRAGDFLKTAGFSHYCIFKNRKPEFKKL